MKSTIEILSYCPFCERNWLQKCDPTPEAMSIAVDIVNADRRRHIMAVHLDQTVDADLVQEVKIRLDCPECPRSFHVTSQPNIEDLAMAAELVAFLLAKHTKQDHVVTVHLELTDGATDQEPPPQAVETPDVLEDTVTPLSFGDILDIQTAKNESAALKAELEETAAAAEWASRCSGVKALVVKFFVQDYGIEKEEFGAALTITDPGPEDHQEKAYVVGLLTIPNMEEIQVTLWGTWDKTIPEVPSLIISDARLRDIWSVGNHHGDLLGPALVAATRQYLARMEWERTEVLESISWNERQMAKEMAESTRIQAVAETLGKYPILIPVLEMVIEHIKQVDQLQEEIESAEESSEEIERKLQDKIEDLAQRKGHRS